MNRDRGSGDQGDDQGQQIAFCVVDSHVISKGQTRQSEHSTQIRKSQARISCVKDNETELDKEKGIEDRQGFGKLLQEFSQTRPLQG